MTRERGVGQNVLLDAASKSTSADGELILGGARAQSEAGMTVSGPDQVRHRLRAAVRDP